MATQNHKLNSSIEFRQQIIKWWDASLGVPQREFATEHGIHEATLRRWLKEREKIMQTANTADIYITEQVESDLDQWIKSCQLNCVVPSADEVRCKVEEYEPERFEGKSYHAKRRVVDRLILRARGFKSIKSNKMKNQLHDGPRPSRCSCKKRCTRQCSNRKQQIECSETCRIGPGCGNRTIQEMTPTNTEVRHLGSKGFGLFATVRISTQHYIGEYVGVQIDTTTKDELLRVNRGKYIMELDEGIFIDSAREGNFTRFINHSCKPNSRCYVWMVDRKPRLAIYTMRPVLAGDEITIHYGDEYNFPECLCGKCINKLIEE